MNDHKNREPPASSGDSKEFIEIKEDELKQVTGGTSKLPGMNKTSDVTLKRGTIWERVQQRGGAIFLTNGAAVERTEPAWLLATTPPCEARHTLPSDILDYVFGREHSRGGGVIT
jgi:bacteriocin-like protein